jgi:hypothetical protein
MKLALPVLAVFASMAQAQDRLHADLPLFTGKNDELSPRSYFERDSQDLSFGCVHRVPMGDWKYIEAGDRGAEPRVRWMRLLNYGAIHCAAYERWSDERSGLDGADAKPSWFVDLGRVTVNGTELEIWALQSGSRPGSDYLLLSRRSSKGSIRRFDVLAADCPRRFVRRGDPIDVWRVDYCVIGSRSDLRSLAKEMAKRPAVGTLTFEGETPGNED